MNHNRLNNNRRWRVIGPGGGGAQYIPTISPHDPRRVLVACDMTGAYITHDGGQSWRMFNLRGRVTLFAFDPLSPDTIYANAIGLWRSDDAGQTWNIVIPDPAQVTGVILAGDHGDVTIDTVSGSFEEHVTALAIDPANSQILYAAIATGERTGLYISSDRGASWSHSAELPDGGLKIYVDPQSPPQDRLLSVVGRKSVQKRQEGRWTHGVTPAGVERFIEVTMGYSAEDMSPVAYAISKNHIYASGDGGMTWMPSALPGENAEFLAIAACMDHPDGAYASYRDLKIGDETFFGVLKTTDRGRSWQPIWKENSTPAENIKDIWVTQRLGPYFGEMPFSLGVAPHDPNLCYGTDWARTLRTHDGGETWRGVYSQESPEGGFTSTGLDVTNCYGIHFDPFDERRHFITFTDIGLFRSENGGKGWDISTDGVPREWINTTYWVVFDPAVRGRMWAAMSAVHDIPRPKMWRGRSIATYKGGICRSDDGGKTWRIANAGMLQTAATHLLLDPNSAPEARTLYAACFGRGVYKSTDGGETWQVKNHGLDGEEPFAWRLTRDAEGTLYLIVARRSEDGRIGDAQDGALYRSTDGAEHWTKMSLPPNVNGPNGLAIDLADTQRLYLAAWSRPEMGRPVGGGIFLSTDRGASWKPVMERDQHIYDITIAPDQPNTLYACGFSSSVWKSTDRGDTWRRLPGFNFKWGQRVIPDPQDSGSIYVTTFGGGLWHGPADGDPSSVEDIQTPALRYEVFDDHRAGPEPTR